MGCGALLDYGIVYILRYPNARQTASLTRSSAMQPILLDEEVSVATRPKTVHDLADLLKIGFIASSCSSRSSMLRMLAAWFHSVASS